MAGIIKEKIKYFLLFLLGMLIADCANQLPPGGGAIDTVPPKIVEVYPANSTTNFSDDHIEFDFSKYVDKRTLKDALFISPAIEGNLQFDWTGTSVKIYFPGALKKNVTYVFTIGSDLQDLNNHNRMAQAYTLTFSTGSKIDRCEISGKVYDEKPEGIMIFAYILGDSAANPMVRKPDYISQTGNDGNYKLLGLAPASYRIFAVRDQYRDLIYQPEQDDIGMPDKDVTLSDSDTLYSGLNFFLTKLDTIKPRLVSATMTDKFHVLVNFTKEIDISTIRSNNFLIIDSTSQKSFKPMFAFKGNTKPTEIVLVTKEEFPAKDEVYLISDSIKDKLGNIFTNDYSQINLSEKLDTTKADIFRIVPQNASSNVDFINPNFSFYFNDAFDSTAAKNYIAFTDTARVKIPYNVYFTDDASFKIIPLQKLEPNTDYIIKLDLNGFKDAAGNAYDSVYQYKFRTINGLDFTGITGTIENAVPAKNPYLILQGIDEEKLTYQKQFKSFSKFSFDRIQPGKYFLWEFYDIDSSKTYTFGKPFPFKPSEQFSFYPDTLNLRARWIQTNLVFKFK